MAKITKTLLFFIFILGLFCINSCSQINKEKDLDESTKNDPLFNIKIITISDSTFGYEIYQNNKLFIRQLNIPAVSGNHFFETKHEAQKVANLVVTKLKNGVIPPTISLVELDSLKINSRKYLHLLQKQNF